MTAAELYAAMCQFAHDHGWRREQAGSGWWYQEEHRDEPSADQTLPDVIEEELRRQGVDMRKAPAVVIPVDAPGAAGGEGTNA